MKTYLEDKSKPLVSIVLPVYNGAQHLAECLDSVLAQTYRNWKCTIVNNCSTDETLHIAEFYASKDARFQISNNDQFLSAIANHNHALRQIASGSKYSKLVFADDWLFPMCLESMVALAESSSSIGIVSSYGLRDDQVLWTGLPYSGSFVSGRDVCRQRLLGGPYVFGTGMSQLFRSDVVRDRDQFYDEANLHCDSEVCFQILEKSEFGFVHQILHYTRAPGAESLTTHAYRVRTIEAMTLYELITYGPVYLTPSEYQSRLKTKTNEYYKYLAQSLLEGDKSWDFHRQKLREFGVKLDRKRLAGAVLRKGIRAVLAHPWKTFVQLRNGTSIISGRLPFLGGVR